MPGNQIEINGVIQYYIGDSKMDELLAWLENNGIKQAAEANAENESANTK